MLDKMKDLFREGLGYAHTAGLLQQIGNILNMINVQYMKDADAKNAAIDILCQMLQSHKEILVAPEVDSNAAN